MTESVKKSIRKLLLNIDEAYSKKEVELDEIRDQQEGFPQSTSEVMERILNGEPMSNKPEKRLIDRISRLQNIRNRLDNWSFKVREDMLQENIYERQYLKEAIKQSKELIKEIEEI